MESMSLPEDNRKNGNCGITALAIVLGVSFDEVWNAYQEFHPRKGNWKGTTHHYPRLKVLKKYGVKFNDGERKKNKRNMSLKSWVHWHQRPNTTYMITTTGHVQVVRNGMVMDQTTPNPVPVADFRCAMKVVKHATMIEA